MIFVQKKEPAQKGRVNWKILMNVVQMNQLEKIMWDANLQIKQLTVHVGRTLPISSLMLI